MKSLLILIFFFKAFTVKSQDSCGQTITVNSSFSGLNFQNLSSICLELTEDLLFDTSFNLEGDGFVKNISLCISNLKGFSMTNSFSLNEFKNGALSLNKNSSFDFYYTNDTKFTKFNESLCKSVYEKEIFISAFNAFSRLDLNENTRFSDDTCPIHFKNAYLDQLYISKLTSTNMLGFIKLDYSSDSINSTIQNLIIRDSEFSLDDTLFDQDIFKNTKKLSILNSILKNIKDELFKNSYLNEIELELTNFNDFIKDSNGWLKDLNFNNKSNALELKLIDKNSAYDFSESDFCSFKDLPKGKRIIPVIQTKPKLNCTCTLLWFLSEKNELGSEKLSTNSTADCLNDQEFEKKIEGCNFEEKKKNCGTTNTTSSVSSTTIITTTNETNMSTTTTRVTSTEANKKDSTNIFEILMIIFIVLTVILIIVLVVFYLKHKKSISKKGSDLNASRGSITTNGTKLYKL